jgi:putative oxidoreductase
MLSRTVDTVAVRGEWVILLVARVLIAALFIPFGYSKLTNIAGTAHYLASLGVPAPTAFAVIAGIVEFFGSLAILFGFKTRYAAALMALFTIIAAFLGHPFWSADAAAVAAQKTNFFKDLAIAGGILFIYVHGAGPLSVDRR